MFLSFKNVSSRHRELLGVSEGVWMPGQCSGVTPSSSL